MNDQELRELAISTLEGARHEVVRRLRAVGLPLSFELQQPVVLDNPEGTGWQSATRSIRGSSLRHTQVMLAIRDDSVPTSILGLREQVEPLAAVLDERTDLGGEQPAGLFPNLTGVEGILRRCVLPFCEHYLWQLEDLGATDQLLLDQMAGEMVNLAATSTRRHICQLAVNGVQLEGPLEHRDIRIRPLSELERGAVLQRDNYAVYPLPQMEFVVPGRFHHFMPGCLLEVETDAFGNEVFDRSSLLRRVVLAFFLHGFDLGSAGTVVHFDLPRWIAQGYPHEPFIVEEKWFCPSKPLDPDGFRAIIELANQTPEFSPGERSRQEIVLDRFFRGSGVAAGPGAGFLDFVIALEGALLGGASTELAYKFALYGALFLSEERPTDSTFRALRRIYRVRCDLVHSTPPKPQDRAAAAADAAELARAVVRRSLQSGWPETKVLDKLALEVGAPDG